MRLKTGDGPLSIHNGNSNDILNSPKRINTLQNSNVTSHYTAGDHRTTNDVRLVTSEDIVDTNTLNNINSTLDKVQWCNPARQVEKRELTNNANNRNQLLNINNTLAASLRPQRPPTASSICSESSPDDSLLEYEDAHQSCSSADTSPQDEDRGFDLSDSDSVSEEGNLNDTTTIQRSRGIINPNYPGFQHLAHTLDYSIKASSDTDFSDDDYECELATNKSHTDANSINNNNNNLEEDTDYPIDKIDSVNRLDSVENIQKVYYDKPVLDIECENHNQTICDCETSGNSNNSDEEVSYNASKLELNIKQVATETTFNQSGENIVGEFRKEVQLEIDRISHDLKYRENVSGQSKTKESNDDYELPPLERAVVQELEDAIEKLSLSLDIQPSAIKYNIEPNIEEPFNKLSPSNLKSPPITFDDSRTVKIINTNDCNSVQNKPTDTETIELNIKQPGQSPSFVITKSPVDAKCQISESKNMEIIHGKSTADTGTCKRSPPKVKPSPNRERLSDAFLSNAQEPLPNVKFDQSHDTKVKTSGSEMDVDASRKPELVRRDSNREMEEIEKQIKKIRSDTKLSPSKLEEIEKFCKEDITKNYREKDIDSSVVKRKSKMHFNHLKRRPIFNQFCGMLPIQRRDLSTRSRDVMNRRSVPAAKERKIPDNEYETYGVYNIDTSTSRVDMETIENHLRAAREEERRRRLDREEIRRRLTMSSDYDYYTDRPGRKPSLHARLQSGMNLQICFMNETVSDTESPSSDTECPLTNPKPTKPSTKKSGSNASIYSEKLSPSPPTRPATLSIGQPLLQPVSEPMTENDFFSRQARLQTEARMALAQAKQMARMQMEMEKQKREISPITEMVRTSLAKIGVPFAEDKRRLSRLILTDMNPSQLKVIVNDLHNQIEILNESLVKLLMERDDLHMEQDSMLVDIEDLTRYLSAKEQAYREQKQLAPPQNNNPPQSPAPSSPLATLNSTVKPHLHRIANLVKK